MGSQLATLKQTGGGGYNYEDKVGAYFMLCLLLRKLPFKAEIGYIEQIELQAAAKGWLFDDYLISLNHNGCIKNVAVSVKSNYHFSDEIVSKALLTDLWDQQTGTHSNVFNSSKDYCCIAQPPLNTVLGNDLNTLLNLASYQNVATLAQSIGKQGFVSESKQKLFNSFSCPSSFKAAATAKNILTGDLLSRFLLLQFDFEAQNSISESLLIDWAGSAIVSDDPNDAQEFYEKLQTISKELRAAGGNIDLNKLIQTLNKSFRLNDFPLYDGDLQKLTARTESRLGLVKTSIGSDFEINRDKEFDGITEIFAKGNKCCIVSPSGFGKTALAKSYIGSILPDEFMVWLSASDFDSPVERTLGLNNSLVDLIKNNANPKTIIVIDGLERFYNEVQLQHLATFLQALFAASADYKLLLTCISGDVEEILLKLYGYNVTITLEKFSLTNKSINFIPLAVHIPAIADILRNDEHRTLLLNIKLLDSVCFALTTSGMGISKEQSTETGFIDFLWKYQIEKGPSGKQLSSLVKQLAQIQADTLYMAVSSATVDTPSAVAITPLLQNDVLYEVDEHLYFKHDLFGDWARYKIIQAHALTIKTHLTGLELSSPLWAKAIRLYGIHLLEKKHTNNAWATLYNSLSDEIIKEKVIKNLLLESVIYSSNAENILTGNKEMFFANDGKILKALLDVVVLKATDVNPAVLAIISSVPGITVTYAATLSRIPNYAYWVAIMFFLHKNKEDVIKLDFAHCAKIVRDWLHFTAVGFPLRKEMAEIAIALATILYEEGTYKYRRTKEEKEDAFEALLTCYPDTPELTGPLILKIAQRVDSEKAKREREEELAIKSYRFFKAEKWLYGPFTKIDDAFEDRVLTTRALDNLINYKPDLASEILLAVLIQEPRDDYSEDYALRQLNLNEPRRWHPPFYNRGPLMEFLNDSPIAAIDCYIKLVDFATEQWKRNFKRPEDVPFEELTINGEVKKYYGEQSVYHWYRNLGSAPNVLVSVLMAVEKYLTTKSENLPDVIPLIEKILISSSSLAFIGLLSSIGKFKTDLFKDVLKPILTVQDFYRWEKNMLSAFNLNIYSINDLPSSQRQEAEDWNKEPNRITPLQDILPDRLLKDDEFKTIYKEITTAWDIELAPFRKDEKFDRYFDRLISFFQPENYVVVQHEGYEFYEYQEPAALAEQMKPIREYLEQRDAGPSAHSIYNFLEKGKTCSLEDIEKLWQMITDAIKNKKKNLFSAIESPLDGIFAGFLLLLKFKEVWIVEHPDYENSIISYTDSIIGRIAAENITTQGHSVPWSWNVFLPEILTYLWKNKDSSAIRKNISIISLNFADEVFAKIFSSFSSFVPWQDPRFIALQNFTLRLSAVNYDHRNIDPAVLAATKESLANEFINNTISKEPLSWAIYRAPHFNENDRDWHHYPGKNVRKHAGLNLSILFEAFKNLPSRGLSEDTLERQHIVFLWNEIFGQMLYQLGDVKPDTEDINDYPSSFDHWVLESVPRLIVEDIGIDFFSNFCEPLLKFGYKTLDWTAAYCSNILLHNLYNPEKYNKLIAEWTIIIAYIELKENWMYRRTKGTTFLPLNLYMMDLTHVRYWENDYSTFTNQARDIFLSFFNRKSLNPPVITAMLTFGLSLSARAFIKEILVHSDKHINRYQTELTKPIPPGSQRLPFYATSELGSFLTYLWTDRRNETRIDEEQFTSYKNLVTFLVSIQNPVGIELQRQLIS